MNGLAILFKYNQKSVSIVTESGQRWNVSSALISNVKSSEENNKNARVVAIDTAITPEQTQPKRINWQAISAQAQAPIAARADWEKDLLAPKPLSLAERTGLQVKKPKA